ncbi:hypothetical protein M8C21_003412, partial [Ambrosia artemisiifolia]
IDHMLVKAGADPNMTDEVTRNEALLLLTYLTREAEEI